MVKYVDLTPSLGKIIGDLASRAEQVRTRPSGTIVTQNADGTKTILGPGAGVAGVAQWVGDTTPPPVPSAPTCDGSAGVLVVGWDGGWANSVEATPPDFAGIIIEVQGGEHTIFTEMDRTLTAAGSVPIALTPGDYQVRLRSFDNAYDEAPQPSPNVSEPSAVVAVTVSTGSFDPAELEQQIADAKSTADEAKTSATAAQSSASAAQSTATQAQSAADKASADLLTLAGKTGRVIYQESKPTGANANANNLWVKTSTGQTYTYDGSDWVLVTDTRLTAAADAAASAQTTATQATTAAATAKSAAETANTAAAQAATAAATAKAAADAAKDDAARAQVTADNSQTLAQQGIDKGVAAQAAADAAQASADAALANAAEYVINGDFTNGKAGWAYWPSGSVIESSGFAQFPNAAHLTGTSGDYVNAGEFPATPGRTYRVAFWAKADAAGAHLYQRLQGYNGSWGGAANTNIIIVGDKWMLTTDWALYTVYYTVPLGSQYSKMRFRLTGHGGYSITGVSVRDITDAKAALDAATAAQSTASSAAEQASLASSQANGVITVSTANPSGAPKAQNAVWWRVDSNQITIGQWRWSGSAWVSQPVGYQAIASVDAATITVGFLSAARIQAGSLNADTVLVNGSIGTTKIKDGAITTPKLVVTSDMLVKFLTVGFPDSKGRTMMNGDRIRMYNSAGEVTIDLDATTGTATLVNANITGTLRTGTSGNRVEISTGSFRDPWSDGNTTVNGGYVKFFGGTSGEQPGMITATTSEYSASGQSGYSSHAVTLVGGAPSESVFSGLYTQPLLSLGTDAAPTDSVGYSSALLQGDNVQLTSYGQRSDSSVSINSPTGLFLLTGNVPYRKITDTGDYVRAGSGWVPAKGLVTVWRDGNQKTGYGATVAFNATATATSGFSLSGGAITVPVTGIYLARVGIFAAGVGSGQMIVNVRVNGASQGDIFGTPASGIPYSTVQAVVPLSLSAGDEVSVYVSPSNSATVIDGSSPRNFLSLTY